VHTRFCCHTRQLRLHCHGRLQVTTSRHLLARWILYQCNVEQGSQPWNTLVRATSHYNRLSSKNSMLFGSPGTTITRERHALRERYKYWAFP
ncbi:hypothetical protein T310_10288, partial [Rasamsonia emersonii CBS 393.64]